MGVPYSEVGLMAPLHHGLALGVEVLFEGGIEELFADALLREFLLEWVVVALLVVGVCKADQLVAVLLQLGWSWVMASKMVTVLAMRRWNARRNEICYSDRVHQRSTAV